MHSNTLTTAVSAGFLFLTLARASPLALGKRSGVCPGDSIYYSNCPSGFKGCLTSAQYDENCMSVPGPFHNDCGGKQAELGNFYSCNGFIGCTTNSKICDGTSSPIPPPTTGGESTTTTPTPSSSGMCPAGNLYVKDNDCDSGFVGCTSSIDTVCPGPKRFWGSCPPNTGTYVVCGLDGFKGCSTEVNRCGRKASSTVRRHISTIAYPNGTTKSDTSYETYSRQYSTGTTPSCPPAMTYLGPGECLSGFIGCMYTAEAAYCTDSYYGPFLGVHSPDNFNAPSFQRPAVITPICPVSFSFVAPGECADGRIGCMSSSEAKYCF